MQVEIYLWVNEDEEGLQHSLYTYLPCEFTLEELEFFNRDVKENGFLYKEEFYELDDIPGSFELITEDNYGERIVYTVNLVRKLTESNFWEGEDEE